jgi:dTDP-4-dehydrorhamnose 3,5-epimerase
MSKLKFIETSLSNVIVIKPDVFGDERGFFLETFREEEFKEAGITEKFIQHNHSRSIKGVLRGLHYQLTQPQGKLVRVTSGKVYDVVVDIRRGSPTFGQWYGTTLDEENMRMMYVPPNFAHGYVVLSNSADFIYMCTDYYHPESEKGILWNDPQIGIDWPITDVILSNKDKCNPTLANQDEDKLPKY